MAGDRGPIHRLFDDGDDEEGEDEWQFSVSEVGPDADGAEAAADGPDREALEPESVSPEHAAFVIAGAVLTLGVVLTAL